MKPQAESASTQSLLLHLVFHVQLDADLCLLKAPSSCPLPAVCLEGSFACRDDVVVQGLDFEKSVVGLSSLFFFFPVFS